MPEELEAERNEVREDGRRPPRAVVGSHRVQVMNRIWAFVQPYRLQIFLSVAAVLVFTATQLVIPLIIRYAIDNGMSGGGIDHAALGWAIGAFAIVILINFAASFIQETVVGKTAEHVLFDMRRAMFAHLQRVSLSFMDKTEVGRLMSRLQGRSCRFCS